MRTSLISLIVIHFMSKYNICIGTVTSILAGSAETTGFVDGQGTLAQFNFIGGLSQLAVCETSKDVYVADSTNHAIRKVTPGGILLCARIA